MTAKFVLALFLVAVAVHACEPAPPPPPEPITPTDTTACATICASCSVADACPASCQAIGFCVNETAGTEDEQDTEEDWFEDGEQDETAGIAEVDVLPLDDDTIDCATKCASCAVADACPSSCQTLGFCSNDTAAADDDTAGTALTRHSARRRPSCPRACCRVPRHWRCRRNNCFRRLRLRCGIRPRPRRPSRPNRW